MEYSARAECFTSNTNAVKGESKPMPITKPFNVYTTIVTTIDPANPEHMSFEVDITSSPNVEIPQDLLHGVAQAACEHTMEVLAETSVVGVIGEVVDDEDDVPVASIDQMRRAWNRHHDDVIDAEIVEVPS